MWHTDVCRIAFCGDCLVLGSTDGSLFALRFSFTGSSFGAPELVPIQCHYKSENNDTAQHDGPVQDIFCLPNGTGFCVQWQFRGAAVYSVPSLSCIYSIASENPVLSVYMNEQAFVYATADNICRVELAQIPSRSSSTLYRRDGVLIWNKQQQIYQEFNVPKKCFTSLNDYIRFAAASPNGEYSAVATSSGFAVLRNATFKWMMRPTGPCQVLYFVADHIIAAGSGHRLLFYGVSSSDAEPLHIILCNSEICSVDGDASTGLFLISQKSGLQSVYLIRIRSPDRPYPFRSEVHLFDLNLSRFNVTSHHLWDVQLKADSLDWRIFWSSVPHSVQQLSTKPGTVHSLTWVWSVLLDQVDKDTGLAPDLQVSVLELTSACELIAHHFLYQNREVHNQGSVLVSSGVQRFWIKEMHPHQVIPELCIWIFSISRCFHILLPRDFQSNLGLNGFDRFLLVTNIETEINPVEIWPESGSIACLSSITSFCNHDLLHLSHIKQIYYMPLLLLNQILHGRRDAARELIACFERNQYLLPTLEFLLHHSMDATSVSDELCCLDRTSPTDVVLLFLREYDLYLQCVVGCARKTDYAHWGRLFPLAGTPLELFQECLREANLSTGSHYLMVLQRTEGSLIAHQSAIRLLDALLRGCELSENTMKLALQLMRFISMSKERNTSNYDRGTELQRRLSDASVATVERSRSGPLPERRPSTSNNSYDPVPDREISWVAGIVDWLTL